MKSKFTLAVLALVVAGSVAAQVKPEDAIKYRQSGYTFMAWNMGRIKANLEGSYNKEEVLKSANAIQAIANSGMGALFPAGTDKGKGWEETHVKPELFTNKEGVAKVAGDLARESNEMAKVAATGDVAAVKEQFGKLGAACKACHDDFRQKHH